MKIDDTTNLNPPAVIGEIERFTVAAGFNMSSSPRTGSALRTLAASKRGGQLLELGTGTGLSTAWLLDGMDATSQLESVDDNCEFQAIARQFLVDQRLTLHAMDGADLIQSLVATDRRFDFIFADTWPGKFRLLDETLSLLRAGGFYVVDDMLRQPNWRDLDDDHPAAIERLLETLEQRSDLLVTKMKWDTGLIIAVKK